MLLTDFIDEVSDQVGNDTEEFRKKLLRLKLPDVEDKVLNATDLIKKNHTVVVEADLKIKLPYDFRYPVLIKKGDTPYYRYERGEVEDQTESYSIENVRTALTNTVALRLKPIEFEYMNIPVLRSDEDNGYGIKIIGIDAVPADIILGEIFDSENRFYPENFDNAERMSVRLQVYDSTDDPAIYADIYRAQDGDVIEIMTKFGLYTIPLLNAETVYYLAENGFTYSDAGLTTLLTRGQINDNNLFMNVNDAAEDDVISIDYVASHQKYISENQIDVLLDTFKTLIFYGLVAEGYRLLKKPNKAREYDTNFTEEFKLVIPESGKVKNMNKPKRFISASRPWRNPASY